MFFWVGDLSVPISWCWRPSSYNPETSYTHRVSALYPSCRIFFTHSCNTIITNHKTTDCANSRRYFRRSHRDKDPGPGSGSRNASLGGIHIPTFPLSFPFLFPQVMVHGDPEGKRGTETTSTPAPTPPLAPLNCLCQTRTWKLHVLMPLLLPQHQHQQTATAILHHHHPAAAVAARRRESGNLRHHWVHTFPSPGSHVGVAEFT